MDIDELRATLADLAAVGELSGRVSAGTVAHLGARRRARHRAAVTLAVIVGILGLAGGAAAVVGHTTASPSAQVSVLGPNDGTASSLREFVEPSASMEPALRPNERVVVDTAWYKHHDVARGDIIVFKAPPGERTQTIKYLVKRVTGLPGDRLSIGPWPTSPAALHRRGNLPLYVIPAGTTVDQVLAEPYVQPTQDCPPGTQSAGAGRVLNPTTVPAGKYFVMGDNRCASEDSRAFGPITQAAIVGRVVSAHGGTIPTTTTPVVGPPTTRAIHRGDIIVFKAPPGEFPQDIKDIVKRVIGLPGDKLSARDNHVFIIPTGKTTGAELNEPYVKVTPDCPAGTQSSIAGPTLEPITVPAGEYFVMGDNRCASADSRAFGPIKSSSIIGLAFIRIWP
jgi:signal peptidase I